MFIIDKFQLGKRSLLILIICYFCEISSIAFCVYIRTTFEITILVIAINVSIDSLHISQSTIYSQETLFYAKSFFIIVIDNTSKRIVFTNHRGSLHIVILFTGSVPPLIVGQLNHRTVVAIATRFTIYSQIHQLGNIVIIIIDKFLDAKSKLGCFRFSIFSQIVLLDNTPLFVKNKAFPEDTLSIRNSCIAKACIFHFGKIAVFIIF